MPPVLAGSRRALMAWLVVVSVAQSAATMGLALLVGRLVSGGVVISTVGLLLGAVAATAATTYGVRVVAERLGQDYVHELRGRLVASALSAERGPSLGITLARATNDLTSVRGWVAQGVPPLVAAGPLVVGALLLLGSLDPVVAVAAATPLVVMGTAASVLMPLAFDRARRLRRIRGRLASRLSDTLQGREGILAAGGEDRERRRLADDSRKVADAAVARARTAGALQAAAAATAAAIAVLVVVAGLGMDLSPGDLATALTVTAALATPLTETGRIAELRQNHRAARRVLAPLVAVRQGGPAVDAHRVGSGALVEVEGLFTAGAGDRIRLVSSDPDVASRVLRDLASPAPSRRVLVDGWPLGDLPAQQRRALVGLAAAGQPLERGTVSRAVRYRRPDTHAGAATAVLERVGLTTTVAALERGERTELRRGGEPLSTADRARLRLARACLGDPPLLLLDRIDTELDDEGRARLREVVDAHPGVVVSTSDLGPLRTPMTRVVAHDAKERVTA
ncbi:ABC transporter ATP-binding protein [Nocardioides sp. CFH 31398]|uniref:ABC transporter transmembrane domain-containing protein n=1 Tax=Nocardioides sp. CFH 31398 TaxID=2919579 RepID=UPI001F061364|nr:ABC transporter ATP-binding protein [Nocardioides sp. CFH 31398]MCH1868709.1 ABC transporter ATP-binding protein/permease [Nocardioides sp. CFH 31398]